MKLLCLLSILCAPAGAGDFYASVGKTTPQKGADPVGVGSIGYRGERHGVEATWIAEARLYDGALTTPDFGMLTGYRYWRTKHRHLGGHVIGVVGLSVKGADRCDYNGESDCNRRLPLPFAFHFGVEWERGDWRMGLYHDSNNAMDFGPEKKNLGVNWLSASLVLR